MNNVPNNIPITSPTGSTKPLTATVRQASALLNVSRRTIYRLIGLGHLRTVHLGRAVRIPVASIEALIAKGGAR